MRFLVERTTRASRLAAWLGAVAALFLATAPVWARASVLRTIVEFVTLFALAQMWNLMAGYAGLVSIGQQAYVGIGAYALLVLADHAGVNVFLAVPLAGLVAALLSIPTGALVFRLRGGYFAVGTWVVAEVFRLLVVNTPSLGGGSGRTLAAVGTLARSTRESVTYWMALALGVASLLAVYGLLRSRLGLVLTAMRDDEGAAEGVGVRLRRAKFRVYVLAAFGCGTTGALVYLNLLRVQPEAAFSVSWSASVIFIVIIGGIGTVEGPILGTLVFFALREGLSDYGSWYLILLGTVAVVVMLLAPRGLWGLLAQRWGVELFPVRRRLALPDAASGGR